MKVFTVLDRIDRMNKLMTDKRTGSPGEFATRLGVSRTSLYEMIDELRSRGAPIVYSKSLRSFQYNKPFEIIIICSLKPLSDDEAKEKSGGAWVSVDIGFRISDIAFCPGIG